VSSTTRISRTRTRRPPTTRADRSPEAVFLDTSALYEAADRGGRRHHESAEGLRELLRSGVPLLTSDLVLAEVHGLTLGRLGPEPALALVDRLVASTRLELVATGLDVVRQAIEAIRARPGRRISLVDATSFQLMRDHGIQTAFALDPDFEAEGFETLPRAKER
jgi:predicted nucleic acid-binding protein